MSEILNHSEVPRRIGDRRKNARVPVTSVAYIELGHDRGGLISDVSESGIAIKIADPIIGSVFPKMRFRLPKSPDWIEASGKLVWQGASRKQAGIQFVDISDEGRREIQNWIRSGAFSPDIPPESDHSNSILEKEGPGPSTVEPNKGTIAAEFDAMFPSEKTLPAARKQSDFSDYANCSTSVSPVDPSTGQAFYEELIAEQAAAMNSLSPRASEGAPQGPLRGAAPTPPSLPLGPDTFTGSGYQPTEFEEPSGKGWFLVAAILVGLLVLGAVLAIGPANVKGLLARHNHDTVVGPRPLPNALEKTHPSPNLPPPSSQTDHSEQEPVPEQRGNVQISESAPKPIITETGHGAFRRPGVQSLQKEDAVPTDAVDSEAVTRRFQREHSETRQQAVPPASAPTPSPTIRQSNDRAFTNVDPQGQQSFAAVPLAVAPPSTPSATTPPSGTVAIRSHFHSIWGSNSSPRPSDGPLQIGALTSIRQPEYPAEAERAHIEGVILLRAIVDKAGAVEIVQLVSGPAILAPSAINAVREWRYRPTFLDGRAAESVEDISVVFRLADSVSSPR